MDKLKIEVNVRPGNIVFDMDEILVNISPNVYKKIRLSWSEFFPFIKDLGPLKDDEVLDRPEFDVVEWLLKDEIKNSGGYESGKKIVWDLLKTNCFNLETYSNLEPTHLARGTLMNPEFMDSDIVKSVIVLTRYIDDEMLESKKEFMNKWFKHPKIKFVPVEYNQKKSDVLKSLGIDWSCIFDDEIENIKDFAENFDLERREFMLPKMGYNKNFPPEVKLLIEEKGGTITFYNKRI